ncbi:MAG: hypothetical protein K8R54_05385 [Bacteroidales bacterium]|nr:hypothetical protein [Bacteroidales bacterium]
MKSNLYKNKYRIPSARLQNWDYSWNAAYFITINTAKHECFFGEIIDDKMILSKSGKIAENYLKLIPKYNLYTAIDVSVVMPNNIHLILILYNPNFDISEFVYIPDNMINKIIEQNKNNSAGIETIQDFEITQDDNMLQDHRDVAVQRLYSTTNDIIKKNIKNEFMSKISPQSGSVSVILRSFKSAVTKYVRNDLKINNFDWQERFYDHIIRQNNSYKRIHDYIISNPENWENDKFYKM